MLCGVGAAQPGVGAGCGHGHWEPRRVLGSPRETCPLGTQVPGSAVHTALCKARGTLRPARRFM